MKPGRTARTYPYRGGQYTAAELAREAGCSRQTMRKRLTTVTPAAAVAMGAANMHRLKREPEKPAPVPKGARATRSGYVHTPAPGVTRHTMGD